MRGQPAGSEVELMMTIDPGYPSPYDGEVWESNGGSLYEVLDYRRVDTHDGARRYQLYCLKLDPAAQDGPTTPFVWNQRKRHR